MSSLPSTEFTDVAILLDMYASPYVRSSMAIMYYSFAVLSLALAQQCSLLTWSGAFAIARERSLPCFMIPMLTAPAAFALDKQCLSNTTPDFVQNWKLLLSNLIAEHARPSVDEMDGM